MQPKLFLPKKHETSRIEKKRNEDNRREMRVDMPMSEKVVGRILH